MMMPEHNSKSKADKKRIVLAEPQKPKTKTRKAGVLKVPIHISEGPQRLPDDESKYIHKARSVEAPLTKMQTYAIAAYKRGVGLSEIAKSSGLSSISLRNTLRPLGLCEETHKVELEELANYFQNRSNP
jgi:hypothetical protein